MLPENFDSSKEEELTTVGNPKEGDYIRIAFERGASIEGYVRKWEPREWDGIILTNKEGIQTFTNINAYKILFVETLDKDYYQAEAAKALRYMYTNNG